MVVKSVISNARIRGQRFVELFSWLGVIVLRRFLPRTLVSASSTVLSIAFQGIALVIIIGAVAQFQAHGKLVTFPGFDRLGIDIPPPSIEIVIGIFIAIYLTGAAFTYIGRWRAIQLESNIYRYFYDYILAFFTRSTEIDLDFLDTIRERRRLGKKHEVIRIVSSDARFAGIIARLALYNIAHLGHIAVGTLIIALYAPFILTFIVALAVISLAVMYPLSLRANRVSRQLEAETPQRTLQIRNALGHLASGKSNAQAAAFVDEDVFSDIDIDDSATTAPGSADDDIVDSYLGTLQKRLQVLELSRITMSSVIGFGIGILVLLLFSGDYSEVVNYSSVLVLFFGLRFGMTGIQGTMVTLTNINRFLPSVLRLEELVLAIDSITVPNQGSPASTGVPELHRQGHGGPGIPWSVNTPGLQQVSGLLLPAKQYALLVPAGSANSPDGLFASVAPSAHAIPSAAKASHESNSFLLGATARLDQAQDSEPGGNGLAASHSEIVVYDNYAAAVAEMPDTVAFISDGTDIVCVTRLIYRNSASEDFIDAIMSGDWPGGRADYERLAASD